MPDLEARLRSLITHDRWLMEVLRTVRALALPDWVVGSGVIRNLVWDHLHGFTERTELRDVDVAYFDPTELSRSRDRAVEAELTRRMPSVPWEVTNQAGVHLWYEARFGEPIAAAASIEDALGTWPETATAVGVRLVAGDDVEVVAPCGLEDLFAMVLRRNPRQVSVEFFRKRVADKEIAARWPLVTIVEEG